MASAPFSSALSSLALVGCLAMTAGCEEERATAASEEQKVSALQVKGVPSDVRAEVHPVVGATTKRPVALVLAQDPLFCEKTREVFEGAAHVICANAQTLAGGAGPEAEMLKSVEFLRKSYPRFTDGSPVFLVADESQTALGWALMLKEPQFFAHAFLSALDPAVFTATKLSAVYSRGGRTLIFQGELEEELKLPLKVASRGGLKVHAVEKNPEALLKGLALLRMSDARTGPEQMSSKSRQ